MSFRFSYGVVDNYFCVPTIARCQNKDMKTHGKNTLRGVRWEHVYP